MNNQPDIAIPITLYPSRKRQIISLLLALMFLMISIVVNINQQKLSFFAIFPTIFFGLGSVVCIIQLIPGSSYLRLTQKGIMIRSLFGNSEILWVEVIRFYVMDLGGKQMIAMDFTPSYTTRYSGLKFLAKIKFRIPGILPDTYGKKAQDLADLLNALHQKLSNSQEKIN